MRRLLATILVAALAIACSGAAPTASPAAMATPASPSATATQRSTDKPANPTSSAQATATPGAHAQGVTLLEQGCTENVARCQDLAAGTYETSGTWAFLRGLTVTLPAGWSSNEQDAGEFELHHVGDVDEESDIFFWRDLVAWVDGAAKPELGTTVDELADYLISDSRITVEEGPRRSFNVRGPDNLIVAGTVEARSFSVIVSGSAVTAPGTFDDCPDEVCIGILSDVTHWGGGTFSLTRHGPEGASQGLRLYIASIGRVLHPHILVIALSTYGPDPLERLAAWEAQVEPIVDSVLVPYIVVDN